MKENFTVFLSFTNLHSQCASEQNSHSSLEQHKVQCLAQGYLSTWTEEDWTNLQSSWSPPPQYYTYLVLHDLSQLVKVWYFFCPFTYILNFNPISFSSSCQYSHSSPPTVDTQCSGILLSITVMMHTRLFGWLQTNAVMRHIDGLNVLANRQRGERLKVIHIQTWSVYCLLGMSGRWTNTFSASIFYKPYLSL